MECNVFCFIFKIWVWDRGKKKQQQKILKFQSGVRGGQLRIRKTHVTNLFPIDLIYVFPYELTIYYQHVCLSILTLIYA